MKCRYTVIKLRVKLVTYESKIWQHKKAKVERKSARGLRNLHILLKNSAEGLGSKIPECCWGCVSMKIHPKNDHILTANVAALRLMSRLHANTLRPDVYWRKWPNQQAYLELCHWNPDILERVLNQIALSNSTVGKCVPMQVTKQTEHGRTSTTKKQKWSSFQMNYD